MMEDDLQLIERKLAGELSPPEETTFSQRLSQDAEFAEQYALGQMMIASLRDHHLKQEMQGWSKAAARQQKRRRQYGIAAAAAFLLTATAAVWYVSSLQPTPQALYETYYTVYPADPVLRGEPTVDYNQAMRLYQEERYQEAIPLFEELQANDSTDPWIALFLGNSHLNTGETEAAIRYFGQVAEADDAIVRRYGQWYLALSYLRNGDLSASEEQLRSLSEQPGMFQRKAQIMLEEM